jgi:hypothetical protein
VIPFPFDLASSAATSETLRLGGTPAGAAAAAEAQCSKVLAFLDAHL